MPSSPPAAPLAPNVPAAPVGPNAGGTAAAPTAPGAVPKALAPLHLRLFALLFDYALSVAAVKLAEQALLGEHWDLRPLASARGWQAFLTPWQGMMLLLLLARDLPGVGVGKWLTGLRLGRADDPSRSPGVARRVLRNLSLIVLPLDAWRVFRDPYGRRLGDRWAGTVVVEHPHPRDLFQRAMGLGVLFLGLILGALLLTSWNLHRSAAFQAAYAAAERDPALAHQVGQGPKIERSPDLELTLPAAERAYGDASIGTGRAIATFDATGPAGRAKLRVELTLVPGVGAEPPRWEVVGAQVLDALGGPLKQKPAPPAR